mmetsp:Transcript_35943/g.71189  ORF Transcript_35943/g.71189 Transcript_35943/m.71189 type:complete len:197 (+) Transcript_35943:53-643(+)
MYVQYPGASAVSQQQQQQQQPQYQNGFYPGAAGGGFAPPSQISGGGPLGGSGPFFPVAQPYGGSNGPYGQQAPVNMFQPPRDPCAPTAFAPASGDGMHIAWQQPGNPVHFNGHAAQPLSNMPTPMPWGPQHPPTAPHGSSTAGPSISALPEEPDPDDDPNRLPTFVKVRGLPAEHDPRIARRPKPKKRAPAGVCCA